MYFSKDKLTRHHWSFEALLCNDRILRKVVKKRFKGFKKPYKRRLDLPCIPSNYHSHFG